MRVLFFFKPMYSEKGTKILLDISSKFKKGLDVLSQNIITLRRLSELVVIIKILRRINPILEKKCVVPKQLGCFFLGVRKINYIFQKLYPSIENFVQRPFIFHTIAIPTCFL